MALQMFQERNQRSEICVVGKHVHAGYVFTVHCDLDIICRLQLAISHMVIIHSHKGRVRICLGIAVSGLSHIFQRFFASFPPLAQFIHGFPLSLFLAFPRFSDSLSPKERSSLLWSRYSCSSFRFFKPVAPCTFFADFSQMLLYAS